MPHNLLPEAHLCAIPTCIPLHTLALAGSPRAPRLSGHPLAVSVTPFHAAQFSYYTHPPLRGLWREVCAEVQGGACGARFAVKLVVQAHEAGA